MIYFQHILILLFCSVITISVFRRINLPPILGYLFVGALVGPQGLKFIPSFEEMHFIGEIGVVFLMFTLGLEFSVSRLIHMRKILLGVGGLQVLICALITMTVGMAFNLLKLDDAFVIGGALALSSTAVVIKQLGEQHENQKPHGQLAISILIFQDIAAIIFIILIPPLSGSASSSVFLPILIALVKGVGVFIGLDLIGKWVLRPLFHEVAKARSTELFILTTLLVALSAAGLTNYLELSMALGAFLAGLMLNETEFRHQIETDIRPFKDILLGLFFITVGALLNLSEIKENWLLILLILIVLIVVKALIIALLAYYLGGTNKKSSFRTGVVLSQGGELGFLILTQAIDYKMIDPQQQAIMISSIVLSIVFAPILIRYNKDIANFFFKAKEPLSAEDYKPQQLMEHSAELSNHVIICGYGRVGQILSRFLDQEKIPSLALDLDPTRVKHSTLAGENVFFGDSTRPDTLAAAGLARARMLVISFSDEHNALEVVKHVRALRLDLPVFVRTKDDANLEKFQEAGATEVVPELLEGSLMLASHLLLTLGVPASKIMYKIRNVHSNRYQFLQGFFEGNEAINMLEDGASRLSLHAVTVLPNSFAINKSLKEITAVAEGEFPIKAITRNAIRNSSPDPDMIIEEDDVLVLYGTPETLYTLEEMIVSGGNEKDDDDDDDDDEIKAETNKQEPDPNLDL